MASFKIPGARKICENCGINEVSMSHVNLCDDCLDEIADVSKKLDNRLKDSGARREFESGAVRDISEGKGRCDLLPLDVIGKHILCSDELTCIERFKETKDPMMLVKAIDLFADNRMNGACSAMLEVSKHFEAGAEKYGENNWKKGIPLHCYLDSAVRHYLKHLRGDTDEPHDRAFVWNLLCAIWTFTHKPELDDVEIDLNKSKILCPVCGSSDHYNDTDDHRKNYNEVAK